MERPTGITIIAMLSFIEALWCVLVTLSSFWGVGLEVAGAKAASAGTRGIMALLMSWGGVIGVVMLVSGVIAVVVGVGLLKLRNWSRILTIILTALSLVLLAASLLLTLLLHFVLLASIFDLVYAGICVWILWYMFRPHVRQAFGTS